jgi:hypothetical protein
METPLWVQIFTLRDPTSSPRAKSNFGRPQSIGSQPDNCVARSVYLLLFLGSI